MSASTAPTRRRTAGSLGKMPTTRARRLISLLTRSSGLVDQIFGQWLRGKVVNASTSAFASSISGSILGKFAASWLRTVSQVAERSEEHTSELQSRQYLVCRLLLEKKKIQGIKQNTTSRHA